jgi:hypothetical protein
MDAPGDALTDELQRVALGVSEKGEVAGVLAAEPQGGSRLYLIAFGAGDAQRWLVVDPDGQTIESRDVVRAAASIVAMCEVAADLAGGGDLAELRMRLAQARMVEQPAGIEEAEEAALAVERAVGGEPRLARPEYLDAVGAATLALEHALGETASPFREALRRSAAVVEEFVRDVERRYLFELR